MKSGVVALALFGLVNGVDAGAVELTGANFEEEVTASGKGAFVKFLAPWWGHCKSMKPAWDKLGDAHADSKSVIIGDVDCTTDENKALCSSYGVSGYPTIKYFTGATAATGDVYKGGRDFDALAKFVEESLGPQCSMGNRDLCSEEQLANIDGFVAMSSAERTALIEEKETAITAADETLDTLLKSLQSQFEAGKAQKETDTAAASENLSIIRMVEKASGEAAKDEL